MDSYGFLRSLLGVSSVFWGLIFGVGFTVP